MLFFKLNLFKKTIDIKLNPAIIISNKKIIKLYAKITFEQKTRY